MSSGNNKDARSRGGKTLPGREGRGVGHCNSRFEDADITDSAVLYANAGTREENEQPVNRTITHGRRLGDHFDTAVPYAELAVDNKGNATMLGIPAMRPEELTMNSIANRSFEASSNENISPSTCENVSSSADVSSLHLEDDIDAAFGEVVRSSSSVSRSLPESSSSISMALDDADVRGSDVSGAVRAPSATFKGIKMSAPSLLMRNEDFISASGSGMLPSVDIDKSFAMSVADVKSMSQKASLSETNVLSDRLAALATRHKIDVMRAAPAESEQSVAPNREVNLPPLIQMPKSIEDAETIRRHQKAFVQTMLFDERRFRLSGRLINYRGLDCAKDVESLMGYLNLAKQSDSPVIVHLKSSCDFGRENALRAFLQRCYKEVDQFRAYAEVYASDGSSCDLVTSLVSSRIGIFPNDEDNKKVARILGVVDEALNSEDRHWGMDILFVRYGLRQYVSSHRGMDISALVNRNESDMLELLESMLFHDVAQGTVVVVLNLDNDCEMSVWRDLLAKIKGMMLMNILIILNGGDELDKAQVGISATWEVSPLTSRDAELILNQVLPYLSQKELMGLASRCAVSLTQLHRVLRIFQRQNPFESPTPLDEAEILRFIDSIPQDSIALGSKYYHSFTTEESRFLSAASILGKHFYLNELISLMSLDALPDEIPGFRDLRGSWCERIASKLMDVGEIFSVDKDPKRGMRFEFPEHKLFHEISVHRDANYVLQQHGCYARILEREQAAEDKIAIQYQKAGMWPEAAKHWLNVARKYSHNFNDQTAYVILKSCLKHIGPQYDEIYPALLRECIALSSHIGQYSDVCYYAGQLCRIGKMLSDPRCSAKAFVDMGNALRVQGEHERAREIASYGLEIAEKQEDESLLSLSNHALARIVFESGAKGSLVNALRYAEKALEIRRRLGDLTGIAQTQALSARIFFRRGEPARAKTAASEAYQALMADGHWYDTPEALCALAESTAALGEAMADDYIERGLAVVDKTGDIEHRFLLLSTRLMLIVNTIQRQAVRNDLEEMHDIIKAYPIPTWIAVFHLLTAMFDYSRKNFQKTTKSLRQFFEVAQKLGNAYILSQGYLLSAELNFEVYRRNLSHVSLEKTEKLYSNSNALFESIGAWHDAATALRLYAVFLEELDKHEAGVAAVKRADKVDPYEQ